MSASEDISGFLDQVRARVERYLDSVLAPASEPPATLHEAMRYAVLTGGKRIRPVLAYAAAEALGGELERVSPVAGAAELVHAYSLVHDDLPAMDDDWERRGQPTLHVKFGEALAILAGDALQALAFGILARPGVPSEVVARLADCAGSRALVGGQVDDLDYRRELAAIASIHERKTAALFRFSAWGAGRVLTDAAHALEALDAFGRHFGLAYQLLDDLDDADSEECSILRVLDPDQTRARVRTHLESAAQALDVLGPRTERLRGLGARLAGRLR